MSNANPSRNPADEGTLAGALKEVFSKLMQDFNNMLPARVINVSEDRKFVEVQPLIMVLDTNLQQVQRGQLSKIPVFQLGGGGVLISFNLKPGNLGFIKANDRDISNFIQSYGEAKPNTFRKNNFSDAVFYPAVMTGFTIADEDAENFVIQNLTGSVRLSFFTDYIKITAPQGLVVDGPITTSGSLTAEGPLIANGGMTTQGGGANSFVVNGNIFTVGNISATGDITEHVPPP